LNAIEKLLTLNAGQLHLLGCRSVGQHLIGRFQLSLECIDLAFQRRNLVPGVLVLPKGLDGLCDFVGIDLSREINGHDHSVSIQREICLLIEDKNQAGRIRSDFIFRDVGALDDGHAFQIRGDLLEGIAFGGLSRQAHGVLARVSVAHAKFTL
jgi:hypothetical protein